jgi:hypothetical protein
VTGARRTPTQVAFGTIAHVRRNLEASPERILEAARRDPADRVLACAARCIQCAGSAEAVRACHRHSCALYSLRPFQADVRPRGAPHHERPDPTFEPLDSYEPEGDD